jgi:DNA-binding transcriptional regulator YiaG
MTTRKRKSAGPDLLADYIREQRKPGAGPPGFVFSMAEFARHVGVSRQQLRMWMVRAVRPNPDHRDHLQEITGGKIPSVSWD